MWSVTHEGGYLSSIPPPDALPYSLYEHERVQQSLYELAEKGIVREEIESLPLIIFKFEKTSSITSSTSFVDSNLLRNLNIGNNDEDIAKPIEVELFSEGQQQAVFSLFCILAGAYVHAETLYVHLNSTSSHNANDSVGAKSKQYLHAETEAAEKLSDPIRLPACLSIPLKSLAAKTQRLPIWDYAGSVLSNWKLLDKTKSISLENIQIIRTYSGLESEAWFYKIHVVIEAYGGQALLQINRARDITLKAMNDINLYKHNMSSVSDLVADGEQVKQCFESIAAAIQLMKLTFSRMTDHCRDKDFFVTLRPWLAGWPKQGVIYSGVNDVPEVFGGASGAQSSLLPSLDAFFGVHYDQNQVENDLELRKFLAALHRYRLHMPKEHVQFLSELENGPSIRNFLALCNEVVRAYNLDKVDMDIDEYHPIESYEQNITGTFQGLAGDQRTRRSSSAASVTSLVSNSTINSTAVHALFPVMRGQASGEVSEERERINNTPQAYAAAGLQSIASSSRLSSQQLHGSGNISNKNQNLSQIQLPMFLKERERMEMSNLISLLQELKSSYNLCIENMLSFRRLHVGFTTMYITRQAKKMAERQAQQLSLSEEDKSFIEKKAETGTGGSTFKTHFMTHINNTRKCLFKMQTKPRTEHEVDVEVVAEQVAETQQAGGYRYKTYEGLREQVEKLKTAREIVEFEQSNQDVDSEEE